ncbi:hypothetical protein K501DRAFT_2382 [Backusella circina FSU 941]|nr:hypothetical protein K501DRAFT_2382 [Backusella circina FSU 941]
MNSFQHFTPQSSTDTPTQPLKRTRAKRSCDFCRKRKSRCDADNSIPCTNCKAVSSTFLPCRLNRMTNQNLLF